jgi:hypothetical protein
VAGAGRSAARLSTGLAALLLAACAAVAPDVPPPAVVPSPPESAEPPLLELRLAYTEPGPDLVQVDLAGDPLFLAPEPLVSDADIVHVQAMWDADAPEEILLIVRCTLAASDQLERATSQHLGEPVAILWQSDLRAATVVRSFVGCERAAIGFDLRDEAEGEEIEALVREWWTGEIRSVAHVRDEIGCADGIRLEIDAAGEEERRDIMEAVRTRWEEDPDGG